MSREALEYLERRLQTLSALLLRERVELLIQRHQPLPVMVERLQVAPADKGMALSLSALVPLILILMTITGAVYPAIDLTAGERERGTLEALIAAPVSRLGLLAAKYIAVLTVALLTATVNLTAMTVTVYGVGLGPHLFGAGGLTIGMALEVFGLLVLFAGFFSAVLLTVTSFARSFKEAQAYLIPLMLLAIAPGLLSLNESLKLDGPLAVAPLVNMVLLGRDLFSGTAEPLQAVVVVLSTLLFAMAALALAARVFGTDALLYGSQGTWSEAFRGPLEPQPTASVATALLCVAVLFPVFYNLHALMGQFTGLAFSDRLWTNSLFLAVLFGVFPLLVSFWRRVRLASGWGLRACGTLPVIGAMLLGLSLWPLVHELALLQQQMGIGQLAGPLKQQIEEIASRIETQPLWLLLVTLAVVPAFFEELFFRGFLYHALAARTGPLRAIVTSGVIFGLFHLFVSGGLATPRLLPTTLLGIVLGWVCYRSGSVLPGMLLHVCHNGAALTVAYYVQELDIESWGVRDQPHLPTTWLLLAAGGVLVGASAFLVRPRRPGACGLRSVSAGGVSAVQAFPDHLGRREGLPHRQLWGNILVPKRRRGRHTWARADGQFPRRSGHVHVRERPLSLARDVLLALRCRQAARHGTGAEAAQEGQPPVRGPQPAHGRRRRIRVPDRARPGGLCGAGYQLRRWRRGAGAPLRAGTRDFRDSATSPEERGKLNRLAGCDARFDILHFEEVSDGEEDETFDPSALLMVIEALARLTDGVAVDPQSGTIM